MGETFFLGVNVLGYAGDFTSRLVDMSNAPPASLRLSWICRTPRQLRSASRGYVERSASFAPALVDMSNAPPASLRLSWIYRTLRQLRSAKRSKIDGPTPVYRRFGRGFSGHRLTARRRYQTK